jgi:hypothetical protein
MALTVVQPTGINQTATYTVGALSATGNITGNVFIGNGSQLTGLPASYGNANVVANLAALGSNPVSTTGNITGGNLLTVGLVSVTGNVTGNYFIGNGSQLTGLPATYGNANVVANLAALGSNPVSTTGNVNGGNLLTVGLISATANITGGNVISGGVRVYKWTTQANTAPANPVPGDAWYDSYASKLYLYINDGTGNQWVDQSPPTSFANLSVTGNIQGGNVTTTGLVSATGNVTGN